MKNGTTFFLPADVVQLLQKVHKDRMDATMSDTIRFLILHGAAQLDYLPSSQMKALGIPIVNSKPEAKE